MQVFVCGMHRSGTSMVARLLNLMGLYFGPEGSGLPPNRENPKGFWERGDVVALNDQLLAATESVWFDVHAFLTREASWRPPQVIADALRTKVLDIDASRPWFVKDPRLCLTLPYWLEHCERPLVVVCSRAPHAVVASLATRAEITGIEFSVGEAVALWEAYSIELMKAVRTIPHVFVRYDDMLVAPTETCAALFDALESKGVRGIHRLSDADVTAFVDGGLQRSGGSMRSSALMPERVSRIDALLLGGETNVPKLSRESSEALIGLRSRLRQAHQLRRLASQLTFQRAAIERKIGNLVANSGSEPWTADRLRALVMRGEKLE